MSAANAARYRYLTTEEAAAHVGCSPKDVREAVRRLELRPVVVKGARLYFDFATLDRFKRRRQGAKPAPTRPHRCGTCGELGHHSATCARPGKSAPRVQRPVVPEADPPPPEARHHAVSRLTELAALEREAVDLWKRQRAFRARLDDFLRWEPYTRAPKPSDIIRDMDALIAAWERDPTRPAPRRETSLDELIAEMQAGDDDVAAEP